MSDTDELTYDEISAAVGELAALTGAPLTEMWEAVREQAGGERDEASLSYGVAEVIAALQRNGIDVAGAVAEADGDLVDAHVSRYSPESYRERERQAAPALSGTEVALSAGPAPMLDEVEAALLEINQRNPGSLAYFAPRPEYREMLGLSNTDDDLPDEDTGYPGMGGPEALARRHPGILGGRPGGKDGKLVTAQATAEGGRGGMVRGVRRAV